MLYPWARPVQRPGFRNERGEQMIHKFIQTVHVMAVAEAEATLDDVPMTDEDYNYEVVGPPVGATVPYLPDEADEKRIAEKTYFVYDGTYYRPFASDGETIYMVVEDPNTEEVA